MSDHVGNRTKRHDAMKYATKCNHSRMFKEDALVLYWANIESNGLVWSFVGDDYFFAPCLNNGLFLMILQDHSESSFYMQCNSSFGFVVFPYFKVSLI